MCDACRVHKEIRKYDTLAFDDELLNVYKNRNVELLVLDQNIEVYFYKHDEGNTFFYKYENEIIDQYLIMSHESCVGFNNYYKFEDVLFDKILTGTSLNNYELQMIANNKTDMFKSEVIAEDDSLIIYRVFNIHKKVYYEINGIKKENFIEFEDQRVAEK